MVEKVRGNIEELIDRVLQNDIAPDVEFTRNVIPLTSFEDVVFGYILGMLKQQIKSMIIQSKGLSMRPELSVQEERDLETILARRIPEIREKIMKELSE